MTTIASLATDTTRGAFRGPAAGRAAPRLAGAWACELRSVPSVVPRSVRGSRTRNQQQHTQLTSSR